MRQTLEPQTIVSLAVEDEKHYSRCVTVEAETETLEDDEVDLESGVLNHCELSMSMAFGPDSLDVKVPDGDTNRWRLLPRKKVPGDLVINIRFGVSQLDLSLRLAGMRVRLANRSYNGAMDLEADIEEEDIEDVSEEHHSNTDDTVQGGVKGVVPALQVADKSSTSDRKSARRRRSRKKTDRRFKVWTSGLPENPQWFVESRDGIPLDRNLTFWAVIEMFDKASESEIEAKTSPASVKPIAITVSAPAGGPGLAPVDDEVARRTVAELLRLYPRCLLYTATLMPSAQ